MPSRPRIAIPVPTSFDAAYNAQSWPEYAAAVERSGATAVRVELLPDSDALAQASFDGILLPGSGADVDPDRYGHPREPESAPPDPSREAVDRILLEQVETKGVPLLAICFGLQSLNVHRGGTLVQHLAPFPVNHRAGRPVLDAHSVRLTPGTKLDDRRTEKEGLRLMVNSSHHQAIGALGDGLIVTAQSVEDNIIEGVEDPAHRFLVGVQWHPERTLDHAPLSRIIFDRFVAAAADTP